MYSNKNITILIFQATHTVQHNSIIILKVRLLIEFKGHSICLHLAFIRLIDFINMSIADIEKKIFQNNFKHVLIKTFFQYFYYHINHVMFVKPFLYKKKCFSKKSIECSCLCYLFMTLMACIMLLVTRRKLVFRCYTLQKVDTIITQTIFKKYFCFAVYNN